MFGDLRLTSKRVARFVSNSWVSCKNARWSHSIMRRHLLHSVDSDPSLFGVLWRLLMQIWGQKLAAFCSTALFILKQQVSHPFHLWSQLVTNVRLTLVNSSPKNSCDELTVSPSREIHASPWQRPNQDHYDDERNKGRLVLWNTVFKTAFHNTTPYLQDQ